MNQIMTSKWTRRVAAGSLAIVMLFGMVAAVPLVLPAQSATPTPATPQSAAPSTRTAALEKAFSAEHTWFKTQTSNLAKVDQLTTKAQALIDHAKANGKNVAGLQFALNVFKSQIASAESLHETAGRILEVHAGFDDSGKVTNVAVATQTVRSARQSLGNALRVMRQAISDLRNEIRLFRSARSNPASMPIPTPSAPAQGS